MQTGKYISNRLIPELIKEICLEGGIECATYSDDWILRLSSGESTAWIYGYHFALNDGATSEISNDKVATYLVLDRAGVPAVPHYLVRSAAKEVLDEQAIRSRIPEPELPHVFKPLSGSSGRYVHYVSRVSKGIAIVEESGEAGWTTSPHQSIEKEYRIIVLDDKVSLVYEKVGPLEEGSLKLFNLGLGATARDLTDKEQIYDELTSLAQNASRALGLRLSAVDVIELTGGELKVLEVNSGISFEHYGRQAPQNRKTAKQIYKKAIELMLDL